MHDVKEVLESDYIRLINDRKEKIKVIEAKSEAIN